MHNIRSTARAGIALATAMALAGPLHAQTISPIIVGGGLTLLSPNPIGSTGGGLGNQTTILTLQSQGNSTVESGCITPTGPSTSTTQCGIAVTGTGDVLTGTSQSGTAFISGITGSTLRLGFNATEPGNERPATINNLALTLYSGTNALAIFTLAPVPVTLENTLPGIGNFGFEFGLTSGAQATFNNFLTASNLSIGVAANLANVTGGPETFNLAVGPAQGGGGGGGGAVVPEPSTYLLLASGLLGLAGVARRRQRQS